MQLSTEHLKTVAVRTDCIFLYRRRGSPSWCYHRYPHHSFHYSIRHCRFGIVLQEEMWRLHVSETEVWWIQRWGWWRRKGRRERRRRVGLSLCISKRKLLCLSGRDRKIFRFLPKRPEKLRLLYRLSVIDLSE